MGKQKDHKKGQLFINKKNEKKVDKIRKEEFLRQLPLTSGKSISEIMDSDLNEAMAAKEISENIREELKEYPPISQAAYLGKETTLKLLIHEKENLNVQIEDGNTPLMIAIERSYSHIIELLIHNGADPSICRQDGTNALMLCLQKDDNKAFNVIWNHMGHLVRNIVNETNEDGHTLLTLATQNDQEDYIKFLLDVPGLEVNHQINNGQSSLMIAAKHNNLSIVEDLISTGSNILLEDKNGTTALCFAIIKKNQVIIDELYSEMNESVKDSYVKGRIYLLTEPRKSCVNVASFYKNILFFVLLEIRRNMEGGVWLLQKYNVFKNLLHCAQHYKTDSKLLSYAFHTLASLIYGKIEFNTYTVPEFATDFIDEGGLDLCLQILEENRSPELSATVFLPIYAVSEIQAGREWLKQHSADLQPYIQQFLLNIPPLKFPIDEEAKKPEIMVEIFKQIMTHLNNLPEIIEKNQYDINEQKINDENGFSKVIRKKPKYFKTKHENGKSKTLNLDKAKTLKKESKLERKQRLRTSTSIRLQMLNYPKNANPCEFKKHSLLKLKHFESSKTLNIKKPCYAAALKHNLSKISKKTNIYPTLSNLNTYTMKTENDTNSVQLPTIKNSLDVNYSIQNFTKSDDTTNEITSKQNSNVEDLLCRKMSAIRLNRFSNNDDSFLGKNNVFNSTYESLDSTASSAFNNTFPSSFPSYLEESQEWKINFNNEKVHKSSPLFECNKSFTSYLNNNSNFNGEEDISFAKENVWEVLTTLLNSIYSKNKDNINRLNDIKNIMRFVHFTFKKIKRMINSNDIMDFIMTHYILFTNNNNNNAYQANTFNKENSMENKSKLTTDMRRNFEILMRNIIETNNEYKNSGLYQWGQNSEKPQHYNFIKTSTPNAKSLKSKNSNFATISYASAFNIICKAIAKSQKYNFNIVNTTFLYAKTEIDEKKLVLKALYNGNIRQNLVAAALKCFFTDVLAEFKFKDEKHNSIDIFNQSHICYVKECPILSKKCKFHMKNQKEINKYDNNEQYIYDLQKISYTFLESRSRWFIKVKNLTHFIPKTMHKFSIYNVIAVFSSDPDYTFKKIGDFGTYLGLLSNGYPTVIRSLQLKNISTKMKQFQILPSGTKPENFSKHLVYYYGYAHCPDDNCIYIASELCEFNISEYLQRVQEVPRSRFGELFDGKLLVQDFLSAMHYLHACQVVHGHLKPSNLMVNYMGRLKVANFYLLDILPIKTGPILSGNYSQCNGSCCACSESCCLCNESCCCRYSGSCCLCNGNCCVCNENISLRYGQNFSDLSWRPQELFDPNLNDNHDEGQNICTKAGDVQVTGMLVYYILSTGHHPFGSCDEECQNNIILGSPTLGEFPSDLESRDMIMMMLQKNPEDRISIGDTFKHPYFWNEERRFQFLIFVEKKIDLIISDSDMLQLLTVSCLEAKTWINYVSKELLELMVIRNKSYKNNFLDLLRFAVELYEIFDILPAQLKIGLRAPSTYILKTFPSIFLSVYEVIRMHKIWQSQIGLSMFFN